MPTGPVKQLCFDSCDSIQISPQQTYSNICCINKQTKKDRGITCPKNLKFNVKQVATTQVTKKRRQKESKRKGIMYFYYLYITNWLLLLKVIWIFLFFLKEKEKGDIHRQKILTQPNLTSAEFDTPVLCNPIFFLPIKIKIFTQSSEALD